VRNQTFCLSIFVFSFVLFCGCGEDNNPTSEPANHTDFEVKNATDRLLRIHMESSLTAVMIEPGTEMPIRRGVGGSYVDFATPSDAFTCISVYDATTQTLVYQQAPAVDVKWEATRRAVRVMRYRLVLTEDLLLDSGVVDNCSP